MTFTASSAGQLIKASVTNSNLRHVGRLGDHMIPENTSGVGVDATYDLGTTTYQWKDVNISGKFYQNGVEFKGGGGGGGGLGLAEAKSWFEKMGQVFPYSDPGVLNESYTRTDNIVLTPRIGTGAGATTIVLDNNKTDIDLMEATTGWTGGKITGTTAILASDTTAGERVQGTASNKLTVTAVSDLAWMIKDQTAFSLIDQLFTASVYLDSLPAGFVKLKIRLSSDAGGSANYNEYEILKADLVGGAGTFNHISIDVNNDTPATVYGTFVKSAVIATHFYLVFDASTTILMAVDYLVRQSNIPIVETGKTYKSWIFDATNQEPIYLNAVAGVTNVTRNIYTCAALTNAYAVGATYAKQRCVTISGQQGSFIAGASGANALKSYDMKEYWLTKSVTADVPLSWRFYDTEYKISSVPSANETRITVASDIKAYFKSGDLFIAYQRQTNGIGMMSRYNATIGLNFKVFTLSANSTYSAPELVLTHATGSNSGITVGNWYVVRFSFRAMALLEAMSANGAMVYVTPVTLTIATAGGLAFQDTFDRSNEDPISTNGWTEYTSYDNGTGNLGTFGLYSNVMTCDCSGRTITRGIKRDIEKYYLNTGATYNVYYEMYKDDGGAFSSQNAIGVVLGSSGTWIIGSNPYASADGLGVFVNGRTGNTSQAYIEITENAVLVKSALVSLSSATWYSVRASVSAKKVKLRFWVRGTTEPSTWSLEWDAVYEHKGGNLLLNFGQSNSVVPTGKADNLIVSRESTGYALSGVVSGTGDKFSQALEYSRSDTANQNPIGYQFDAYVPGLTE